MNLYISVYIPNSINKTRQKRRNTQLSYEFLPWFFEKPFERIIVQTALLKQNSPIMLSFFFKEVVDVGLFFHFQLFEQLVIIDAPLLLTTTMDAIAALPFKPIRSRRDVMVVIIKPPTSRDFLDLLRFR